MLSNIQKNILVRALRIRQKSGENPAEAIKSYVKLTDQEQEEVLAELEGGRADPQHHHRAGGGQIS